MESVKFHFCHNNELQNYIRKKRLVDYQKELEIILNKYMPVLTLN